MKTLILMVIAFILGFFAARRRGGSIDEQSLDAIMLQYEQSIQQAFSSGSLASGSFLSWAKQSANTYLQNTKDQIMLELKQSLEAKKQEIKEQVTQDLTSKVTERINSIFK